MSGAAPWLLLGGALAVPGALLLWGTGLHRRPARERAVFRGASLGFVVALPLVVLALVVPPLRWPPEPFLQVVLATAGLPLAAGVGALAGLLLRGGDGPPPDPRSQPERGAARGVDADADPGVDQGRAPRVS